MKSRRGKIMEAKRMAKDYDKVRKERIAKGMVPIDTSDNSLSRLGFGKSMDAFAKAQKRQYQMREFLETFLDKYLKKNDADLTSLKGLSIIVQSSWVGHRGGDCESLIQRYESMGLEVICKDAYLPLPGTLNAESVYCLTFKKRK